ncbi:MAG: peptidoglycan DD-metalloendopeptidase family protein [Oscillospiraceae bacterium]|nr:peptidoglycan DD-metalloendopeptidase family protein [Oscillospiraceae bacterium]
MKKRLLSALLALGMVLSLVCLPGRTTAYGQTANEQLAETRAKIAELDQQLATARANKNNVMEQKYLLDKRCNALMEEIELIGVQISETTLRIEENESVEADQYELFCNQVCEEEERGVISYWSVLFKATGFADLLSRLDFINEVADYDKSVIDDLRTIREKLAEDRAALQQQEVEMNAAKAELETQIAEAGALIAQYSEEEGALQALHDEKEADAARLEQEIREAEERARREEEERRRREEEERRQHEQEDPQPVVTESGYAWPTNDTRLITSPFGQRPAPGGIYSTNHGGVDIGANYGTNVLASKSGTVLISRWYGGYGYCVVIQHGYGNITLYGHMSRLLCSEGQQVSQGQVIGLVGSTGNSTGPHIHFEIHENGVRVNPLNYLTGWVRGFS